MPVVPCKICGTEFYVRPKRHAAGKGKYCSRACAAEAKRKRDTVECPWCGKQFIKRSGQVYCSRSCACYANHSDGGSLATGKKTCIVCGEEFKKGVRQRICSLECLLKRHEEREGKSRYALDSDPWATGAIPPTRYADDLYRMPDVGLGF